MTLNYGVRWEPYLAAMDNNGFQQAFSRENFDKGIRSVVYPNAPVGLMFKGDPGSPAADRTTTAGSRSSRRAPASSGIRRGNNEQTIRAGIGHYYDSPRLWAYARHPLNPPFGNRVNALAPTTCPVPNRNGCAINFSDPWANTPGGDPLKAIDYPRQGEPVQVAPSTVTFPVQGGFVSMPVDLTPMQVTQWNLSYQRQFWTSMMFDVTYMGNQIDPHLVRLRREPRHLHPGQLPGGPVRAHRRRPVLEHDHGEPAGAIAPDAAEPGGGPVLRRQHRRAALR